MPSPRCWFVLLFAVLSSTATAACRSAQRSEQYSVRGKIIELSRDEVFIHHERIPAIRTFDGAIRPMESMAMSFARDQTSLAGLAVGDAVAISFTVHFDSGPTLRLSSISKLPAETALELR
jgi:Cu/Ag efflux protein CusF